MDFTFDAPIWRWDGEAAWHFISLPPQVADEIEDAHGGGPGFGSVRVQVRIGATTWSTSVFPDTKRRTFILPVKKTVRDREDVGDGDTVTVHLTPHAGSS